MTMYEDQAGNKYIRVKSFGGDEIEVLVEVNNNPHITCDDTLDEYRTISPRRIKGAIRTDDYLRLCLKNLNIWFYQNIWSVGDDVHVGQGSTLWDAYDDYQAIRIADQNEL